MKGIVLYHSKRQQLWEFIYIFFFERNDSDRHKHYRHLAIVWRGTPLALFIGVPSTETPSIYRIWHPLLGSVHNIH